MSERLRPIYMVTYFTTPIRSPHSIKCRGLVIIRRSGMRRKLKNNPIDPNRMGLPLVCFPSDSLKI